MVIMLVGVLGTHDDARGQRRQHEPDDGPRAGHQPRSRPRRAQPAGRLYEHPHGPRPGDAPRGVAGVRQRDSAGGPEQPDVHRHAAQDRLHRDDLRVLGRRSDRRRRRGRQHVLRGYQRHGRPGLAPRDAGSRAQRARHRCRLDLRGRGRQRPDDRVQRPLGQHPVHRHRGPEQRRSDQPLPVGHHRHERCRRQPRRRHAPRAHRPVVDAAAAAAASARPPCSPTPSRTDAQPQPHAHRRERVHARRAARRDDALARSCCSRR